MRGTHRFILLYAAFCDFDLIVDILTDAVECSALLCGKMKLGTVCGGDDDGEKLFLVFVGQCLLPCGHVCFFEIGVNEIGNGFIHTVIREGEVFHRNEDACLCEKDRGHGVSVRAIFGVGFAAAHEEIFSIVCKAAELNGVGLFQDHMCDADILYGCSGILLCHHFNGVIDILTAGAHIARHERHECAHDGNDESDRRLTRKNLKMEELRQGEKYAADDERDEADIKMGVFTVVIFEIFFEIHGVLLLRHGS